MRKIEGKKIAEEISAALREEFQALGQRARLGVIVMEPDFATEKFIAIKRKTAESVGVDLILKQVPPTASTEEVVGAVKSFGAECDGLIVQLPLASHIDVEKVIAAIPGEKDVDGMTAASGVFSPVVEAMREVLSQTEVSVTGKKAVVVGQGKLVGLPAAEWLRKEGAYVSVVTEKEGNMEQELSSADIVVLGAGHPGLVKPDMLREGVVLLDMGTSEAGGKLAGDADASCAAKASVFTPVPGGIGPIAVVMIFRNLLRLLSGKRG